MGQVTNELDHIRTTLNARIYKTRYAYIHVHDGLFKVRELPLLSDDNDSLEYVEYAIINGSLYVKGTMVNWKWLGWGNPLNMKGNLYQISEKLYDKLYIPPDCLIKDMRTGIFRRLKKYVIDIDKNPTGQWLKRKNERPFEFCLHPYKLQEK